MELMTASRLKAARACQRLHRLEYVEGYRPAVEDDTLRFGTLVHRGLEAWWQAAKDGADRLSAALAAMTGEADPFERAKAEALMTGYSARWSDQVLEVLAVEVQFDAPLVNPETGRASPVWRLAGKIDAIVRDRDGRVLVVEHKTSSEDVTPGSDYWRRLRMDGQISTYFDGATALGFDVQGCLYDVISKPGQKPLKATPPESRKHTKDGRLYANQRDRDETPEEYGARIREAIAVDPTGFYARYEVARLEDELREHRFDVWQTAAQIREARNAGVAPRNPDACKRFGRTCPFFDVCSSVASLDDPGRFRRITEKHPELAEQHPAQTA